uniref:Uncharacterized protein n=1 Tax=Cyprinus carpio TaxID=7962 RepID=A0A8C1N5Q3_CYPCA
ALHSFHFFSCSADWSIDALLHKWDLKCRNVPLETFDMGKEGNNYTKHTVSGGQGDKDS